MALLCCFLLIVEKIPIVECERLYELTWSSAQSEGSKWPLGLRGPARKRTRAESARATPGDGDSAWEGSGEGFQALINEKACFELAGPQEQLAKWDEENRERRGDPGGEGRGEAERGPAPLSGPAASVTGRPARAPAPAALGWNWCWGIVSSSPAACSSGSGRLGQACRTPEEAGSGDWRGYGRSSPRRGAPDPCLRLLAFCLKAVSLPLSPSLSSFLSHARSLSLFLSLSPEMDSED